MTVRIEESWKRALAPEFEKPYWTKLTDFVRSEYKSTRVYPEAKNIFAAFDLTPLDKVKVVIIGQDPYHGPGQAHGLSFSVREGVAPPPSLINIYKEIETDLGRKSATIGDLTSWAEQGVLLLNSTLTVRAHTAASHSGKGWEQFTDAAMAALSQREGIVYILWGAYARRKGEIIDKSKNLVLTSVHPSPLAAHNGFFGSRPFSAANAYLIARGENPIEW
ncbi:MAG: uracil-DNA glycosylase [Alphaproteobacteria bacterium]|nr:uracil-DNA glycosylase [Alphaproteobacteria bacterium]